MNNTIKSILVAAVTVVCGTIAAQNMRSAYFNDGYLYRHSMNPAIGNDTTGYWNIPGLGNINVTTSGNFDLDCWIMHNPLYPNQSEKKWTTFMNPYIPASEALSGFNSGDNKLTSELNLNLFSMGWSGWGGYNTVSLNVRTFGGLSIPYEYFEFAKNIGNESYNLGDAELMAQAWGEIALGHSRDINERLRVGGKLKLLVGLARMDMSLKNMKADLSSGDSWTISGDASVDISVKGAEFKSKVESYDSKPGTYERVDEVNLDNFGVNGFGAAVDLGATYKLRDDLTLSASLLDLGFISWGNDVYATYASKTAVFNGFHDTGIHSGDANGTIDDHIDSYKDQLADFINLQDMGDRGGRTTMLHATMHLGAEYTIPTYKKMTVGLLATHRFAGTWSWTEARLSANWKPLKWLSGNINGAVNNYGASMGWLVNLNTKHVNFFLGMDHIMHKVDKSGLPVDPNVNLAFGLNFKF